MSLRPLVSVVIPAYNQGLFLSDALTSVAAQTYENWECIIVNDGSTDDTGEVAQHWSNSDSRFISVHILNQGVSNARNVAVAMAKGGFILPLDGDDKISKNYIEEMVQALLADETLTVAYGGGQKFGVVEEEWELADYNFDRLIFSNMIHVSGMFRKSDFDKVGGYDTNMHDGLEDWEFYISLLQNNGKVKKIPHATLYYRVKEESRMTGISTQKRYRLLAYLFYKHRSVYEPLVDKPQSPVNLEFAYSFLMGAEKYFANDGALVEKLQKYYTNKLRQELKKYTFIQKKKILVHWYKKGKLNLSLWDVLIN